MIFRMITQVFSPTKNFPLYIFVIAVFDLPREIIEVLDLPVRYYLGGNPPWLIPLLIVLFCTNVNVVYKRFNKLLPLDVVDILMLGTFILWMILYIVHNDYAGGGWQSWGGAYLITSNLWIFLSLYILKCYSHFIDIRNRIVDVTIRVLTFFTLWYLLVVFVDFFITLPFHNELKSNNGIAIWSSFCILLILFTNSFAKQNKRIFYFILLTHIMLIVQTDSRASIILICLLFLYKILSFVQRLKTPYIIMYLCFSCFVLLTFLYYQPILTITNEAKFAFYNLQYLMPDPELTYDLIWHLDNSLISAVSRIQTNIFLINNIISHPFIGIGYENSTNMTSFGYIPHTYYLILVSSYGLLGNLPYLTLIFVIFYRGLKQHILLTIPVIIFVATLFTFLNDMTAWLSIVIFLIQTQPKTSPSSFTISRG